MTKWFVYYSDDYDEMGGVGLEACDSLEIALAFIESRLQQKGAEGAEVDLNNYTLIQGNVLPLVAVSQITKVGVK
jgi:hypothetical protein